MDKDLDVVDVLNPNLIIEMSILASSIPFHKKHATILETNNIMVVYMVLDMIPFGYTDRIQT